MKFSALHRKARATGIVALVLAVAFFDWNSLRGPIARSLSARLERPVSIGGLHAALLNPHPRLRVRGAV